MDREKIINLQNSNYKNTQEEKLILDKYFPTNIIPEETLTKKIFKAIAKSLFILVANLIILNPFSKKLFSSIIKDKFILNIVLLILYFITIVIILIV